MPSDSLISPLRGVINKLQNHRSVVMFWFPSLAFWKCPLCFIAGAAPPSQMKCLPSTEPEHDPRRQPHYITLFGVSRTRLGELSVWLSFKLKSCLTNIVSLNSFTRCESRPCWRPSSGPHRSEDYKSNDAPEQHSDALWVNLRYRGLMVERCPFVWRGGDTPSHQQGGVPSPLWWVTAFTFLLLL